MQCFHLGIFFLIINCPIFFRTLEIEPYDARFYLSRGTFKEKENYEDAIEDYTKAIEIDLNNVFAYRLRADLKRKLGDNKGADEDDKKADKLKSMERKYDSME